MKTRALAVVLLLFVASCSKKEETETTMTEDTSTTIVETPLPTDTVVAVDTATKTDTTAAPKDDMAAAGKSLFYNAKLGSVRVACADCHTDGSAATKDAKLRMGHPLAGVTKRASTWNGEFTGADLAPNAFGGALCAKLYQNKLSIAAKDIESINKYLASLEAAPGAVTKAIPIQWVTRPELKAGDKVDNKAVKAAIKGILRMPGDAGKGAAVYARSCGNCHGLKEAKIGPALQDGFMDVEYATRAIRMGSGTMPFYATNVLTDQQVSDVIAYVQESLAK